MNNLKAWREKREQLLHQQRDLFNRAEKEERTLTTDENDQFDLIEKDVAELRRNIQNAEKLAQNLAAQAESSEEHTEEKRATYDEAFFKYARRGMSGLNDLERSLMLQSRGTSPQSSVDAEGGYTIPEGFSNELFVEMAKWGGMLQAGRLYTTATGNPIPWPTVDDTAAVATLVAENAASTVQDMTFGSKTLNSYTYRSGLVKVPVELMQDSFFDLQGFLREALGRRLGVGINAALTTADGSSKPQGFVPAATSGLTAAAVAAVTRDELVDLLHSVDPAYRVGGQWMFNDSTLAAIKKLAFGSSDDRPLWQSGNIAGDVPATLEGYSYTINQSMADLGASAKAIAFGDFSKYIIRMVGGTTFMRLNERFADNLQIGFQAYQRVDGELLSANAIKVITQAAA